MRSQHSYWLPASLLILLVVGVLYAEQPDSSQVDLYHKVSRLQVRVDSLLQTIEAREQQDELETLLKEAEQLKNVERKENAGVAKKFHTGVRRQSGLNPNISMSGDFFGGISNSDHPALETPSDFSYGQNGFYLREVELSFCAPLDPFTRGKTFISVAEDEIEVEEGYLEWLNLPLGMNLKLGVFNAEFGILNRYHDHALPQFERPKVLTRFFSTASLGGTGVAANFLLPPLFGAHASLLDVSLIHAGSGYSFTRYGDLNLVTVGNMTHFYDITHSTFFEWRLGAAAGYNDPNERYGTVVGNLAFNLKWIPEGRSKYRTVDWKTEILLSHRNHPGGRIDRLGFYSSLQNKINSRWWISGRIDYVQWPTVTEQSEWGMALATDFWQSDFVFLRLEYQYNGRHAVRSFGYDDPLPDDHALIFQVNWAMGPHKHEAY